MAKEKSLNVKVTIKDARLSFPRLFKAERFDEKDISKDPTFGCHLILDKKKDAATIKLIQQHIKDMSLKKFGEELESSRICLRDGKTKKDLAGYGPDIMFLSCTSKMNQRPWVGSAHTGQLLPVQEGDEHAPYAGCYVNATVTLWTQQGGKWGTRVNCQVRAVAYRRKGDPFGARSVTDGEEEFADLQGDLGGDEEIEGSDLL